MNILSENQLALSAEFRENETLGSNCSRTAAANGIDSAKYFGELFGFSFRGLLIGQTSDMTIYGEITGTTIERLTIALVSQVGRNIKIGRHQFARRFTDPLRCRLCPKCVLDEVGSLRNLARPYGRKEWLLNSIRCCPVHDCEFVRLPGISWQDSADFTGLIRRNFEAIERAAMSPTIAIGSSGFERIIANRLNSDVDDATWLDTLPIQAAIHFTEILGAVIRHGPEPDLEAFTQTDWVDAGREGIAITSEGRGAVAQTLADIASRQNFQTGKLTVAFGRLATELLEYSDTEGYGELISMMREMIE